MLPTFYRQSLVILSVLFLASCQTPFIFFPGEELTGEVRSTNSFEFANEFKLLQLEVNPEQPYSVWLRVTIIEGQLYIDANDGRRWHKYLRSDPSVRIKLGEYIYRATARQVTSKEIAEQFLSGRTIFRIDPGD